MYYLIFLLVSLAGFAQTSECFRMLNQVTMNAPAHYGGKTYCIQYGVRTKMRNATTGSSEQLVTIYMDSLHYHVLMDQVSMHTDPDLTVSIMKDPKVIMINELDQNELRKLKNTSPLSMDSLYRDSFEQIYCKPVTGKPGYNREMMLKPKGKLKATGVVKVLYRIDDQKHTMYQVRMYYGESSVMEHVEYTFYKVDYNHKNSFGDQKALSILYDKNGALKSPYKGFKVIDNRKIKN